MLGTYLNVTLTGASGADDSAFAEAFAEAERLERIFSRHVPDSGLAQLNRAHVGEPIEVEEELYNLLNNALDFWESSAGAFNPFGSPGVALQSMPLEFLPNSSLRKLQTLTLDLNGIAKGYIVDRVTTLLAHNPRHAGCVNAGGDLRFFNSPIENVIALRLGPLADPIVRSLTTHAKCLATSSPSVAEADPDSTTTYSIPLREPLSKNHSAVVLAHDCASADALTKVALFADPAVIERCAHDRDARVLLFDATGELCESYGVA